MREPSELPRPLGGGHPTGGLDGDRPIDQRPQAVIGGVGRCRCVAGCPRDGDRHGVRGLTCSGMGRDRGPLGGASPDLAASPGPPDLNGLPRPIIRAVLLEQGQEVFRTVGSPCREEPVIGQRQRPTAMGCDEPPVTHRRSSPCRPGGRRRARRNSMFAPWPGNLAAPTPAGGVPGRPTRRASSSPIPLHPSWCGRSMDQRRTAADASRGRSCGSWRS